MPDRNDSDRSYDLDRLRESLLGERSGSVDDSIPELATASPDVFGLALVFADGVTHTSADAELAFPIQSAVKPFLFALALADRGDEVLDAVGTEPTGEAFDAIRLESGTGRPPNPMVNAGALLTASLVSGSTTDERIARITDGISRFAGTTIEVDAAVHASEVRHGNRNRALAHLMLSEETLHVPVDDAVEAYAYGCSLSVTAASLAVMGATLAFGGRNPVTGERVVSASVARNVLAVMATCGVYDGSGEWLRRVGVPAKSGVSGSIVMSAPNRLGAAAYSPPLDSTGTTVRGARAFETLSDELKLHAFEIADS